MAKTTNCESSNLICVQFHWQFVPSIKSVDMKISIIGLLTEFILIEKKLVLNFNFYLKFSGKDSFFFVVSVSIEKTNIELETTKSGKLFVFL